ncbi:flavodoxin, partial [Campylobacter sp. RM12321]|nr:flavodoxin [Campylobacter sp. RM12321]
GANVIGQTELNGYKFNNSEFFKDGKFFGLAVDFKGDENYQKRVLDWVNDIKVKFKG